MKKILYILLVCCCLWAGNNTQAQLLQPGDAVVTMSGSLWTNNTPPSGSKYVLEIFKTRNTSAAPIGAPWAMTPAFYATYSYKHPQWVRDTMGNIFGVAIDGNRNIYTAATGFYGTQVTGISTGQVWKIDASTGAVTAFKNLHASGQNPNCLGNLKVFGNFLYVANLADGKIYVIDIANPAANFTPFDPGGPGDTRMPYGLAIRTIAGNPRLFYSLNNFNATTTEIKSIGISGSNFTGTEQSELSNFTTKSIPITDIAFTQDNSRMILGERTSYSWTSSGAHASTVLEYIFNGVSWVSASPGYVITGGCAGGISFSKAVIGKNAEMKCDTTIWSTADYMFGYTYGMTGFRHQNGQGNLTGVDIDFDNDFTQQDKTMLGDVEVCDTLLNCANCECGQWGSGGHDYALSLTLPASGGASQTSLLPCGASYSFVKGQVTGILNANYTCTGTCEKVMNWTLINTATNTQIASGNAVPVQLSQFNNLACGSYKIVITPKCGNTVCTPCEFNITVVCDPPSCCPEQTQITVKPNAATYNSNPNPNLWGTYAQSFTLNSNVPISEIRINVEHFELNSNLPDCIACRNIPKTWGSFLGAAFNGNGFTPAVASLPLNTSYAYSNNRELVYKPGSLIMVNNATLNVTLAFPNASLISCCELTANVCLKITFKDANCRECTYLYCNEKIPIKPTGSGNPNGNPINEVNRSVIKSIL